MLKNDNQILQNEIGQQALRPLADVLKFT